LQLILAEKRLGPPAILIAVKNERKNCEKEQTFQKQKKNCAFLFQDLLLCCFRKKRKN